MEKLHETMFILPLPTNVGTRVLELYNEVALFHMNQMIAYTFTYPYALFRWFHFDITHTLLVGNTKHKYVRKRYQNLASFEMDGMWCLLAFLDRYNRVIDGKASWNEIYPTVSNVGSQVLELYNEVALFDINHMIAYTFAYPYALFRWFHFDITHTLLVGNT